MLASSCWVLRQSSHLEERDKGESPSTSDSPLLQMLLQKGSREDAIHALINTWLSDPSYRCGWCQAEYKPEIYPCCEQPYVANNAAIFRQFLKEKEMTVETRANDHASNKDKTMRFALSFPPGLLKYLTLAFKTMYQEELFNEEYDINWFARKFRKYFTIPRKV